MKNYRTKSHEEKKKEIGELISLAEKGIENIFKSEEDIKEFAEFMSKFYKFSARNTTLIQSQFPGAVAVGSYAFWKDKGYAINKGEKGIKILAPTPLADRFINKNNELVLFSKATDEEKELIKNNKLTFLKGQIAFKQVYVFDISQTNAPLIDLPKIFPNKWIEGDVKNYDLMYKSLKKISTDIGFEILDINNELGVAKGITYISNNQIGLNHRNSELQNIKTLIHELAHAKLHSNDNFEKYTSNEKEFQAELTAYTVCKYFNLDTSEYSFSYIKDWTNGVEFKDKENLLNEVKQTVYDFISSIEDTLSKENLKDNLKSEDNMIKEDKEREIRKRIREHEKWIKTRGLEGQQLILENENLKGMLLLNLDLRNSVFRNVDVSECVIYADLRGATFESCKMEKTNWKGSNLNKVTIEANQLNLIEYQLDSEKDKHLKAMRNLKSLKKEMELER